MSRPVCNHVHMLCKDLDAMIAFWVDLFEAKLIRKRKFGPDDGAEIDLGTGTQLWLKVVACEKAGSGPVCAGVDHLGMTVPDLDAFMAKAQSKNVPVLVQPFGSEKMRCIFIGGPEGIRIEVMAHA